MTAGERTPTTREASCDCGQLSALVTGDPVRVSICHCLSCRRRTGSAFGVQGRFDPAQVEIRGTALEYVRLADDDGEPRRFRFCPTCGTTLYWTYAGADDILVIAIGAFADPDLPAPTRVVYPDRRLPWVTDPSTIEVVDG